MAVFVVIAVLLTLVVLGGVLWPLWRESRVVVLGGVLALGVAVFALYRVVGTPAGVDAANVAPQSPASLDQAIAELRAALEKKPDEPEGWRLLGQSLAAQQDFAGALDAYARALKLAPDDADLLVETAQVRMLSQRKADAETFAMLSRALELQPNHQRARWFLGVAQRQSGQSAEAAKTWEPLLAMVDANTAASLRAQIDAARSEAGMPPLPAPEAAASPIALTVKVALDPDFASRVRLRGDASVFVIARIPGGPPMPVAVEKHPISALPLTVTLDDADSPMPTQKLSALKQVEVLARISASGNAMRGEGDIESAPVQISIPADKPVELLLGK